MVAPGALVATALTLVPAAASAAGTLTVDQGSTSCTDTRTASTTAPFCTISAAAGAAQSGDIVQVAAGTYHEQVTAPSGVTFLASSPATVVDGNQSLGTATWTAGTGTTFSTVLASKSAPNRVLYNGTPLTAVSGWTFTPATRTLTVDLGGTDPTGTNIAAQWSNGFFANGTTGVVIDGFTLLGQVTAGVNLSKTTNATVQNVTARNAGSNGVLDSGGSGDSIKSVTATSNGSIGIKLLNTTSSSVTSSTASNNGNHGISAQGGSGAHIADNVATGNTYPTNRQAAGIDVSSSSTGAVVERNTTYGNQDSGIEIYTGSTGATVRRNVTYNNGDHGIDISKSPNASVVSNTVVGNATSGINVEGLSTNTAVHDDVAVDNAVGSTRGSGNIRVEAGSETGSTLDRDLVFQSDGTSALFEWGVSNYYTLDSFRQVSGQEANGLAADPKFASLGGRDLHLTPGSPALDAADSGAAGWTNGDHDGNAPADQQDVKDSGTGPVTYADLGAFELGAVAPPPPVDNPPTPALVATPNSITEGGTVTLDASGSTDDHGITGYTFDCGATGAIQAATQDKAKVTCTYPTAGTYQAGVAVTDGKNAPQSATATVTVSTLPPPPPPVDNPPHAALTTSSSTITEGDSTTLDASGSSDDNGISGYSFSCDGGNAGAQNGATMICTYPTAGTYHPSVTVTDAAGQSDTANATVTVNAAPTPTAALSLSASKVRQLVPVTLDASGSSGQGSQITSYQFTCDRQQPQPAKSSPTATCTFRRMGAHSVQVVVTNAAGKTATASKTVTVLEGQPPTAQLTLSSKYLRAGQRVKADASKSTGSKVSPIVAYRFQCGTQQRTKWGAKATAGCTFRHTGWHTITVWVKNTLGQVSERSRLVHVSK